MTEKRGRGRPRINPNSKMKARGVCLSDAQWERLQNFAKGEGETASQVIRSLVDSLPVLKEAAKPLR